ncbi:hypothetical protein PISMIDRAFT_13850 [Pisolithus microcarpus 441]|uniref:Unplaced genomic scaffold scaffold_105, whole genome shotgun sequence n=1 Tax=Pisolithus microcarpus 441 TaxID=765257 RepID=A0A0C9YYY0_9AGAM|nr:hypothetical protein PISMIDRAFT_13850 [Pisolithus microcarpus 441]
MDNTKNNTAMMDQLADLLNEQEPPLKFVTKDRRIMCFAHIINLCVQDVISGFTAANVADDLAWAWHDDTEEKDKYIEAMRGNPLALAHYAVHAIRASRIQYDEFASLTADGNRGQWFKSLDGEIAIILDLQLLHDVKTQWDLMFLMLNHLCALQPTVDLFMTLPSQQKELAKVKISNAGWSILQDYENILKVPHKVQQQMSVEARPTLSHAVPSFKLFMTAWEKMQQENQHLAPFIEVGLIKARHYYNCMDNMKAYIISMFVDPFLWFCWIKMHWVQDWVVHAEESMITLMKEYHCLKVPEDAITQSLSQFDSLDTLAQQFNICDMALGGPRPTEQQSM